MKKLCFIVALAAISFSSVYAAPVKVKQDTMQQDTTKKKVKMKNGKKKMKMKNDSTKVKMKIDTTHKM